MWKCWLIADLIEKKNPETIVKQLFRDLFRGDNRSTKYESHYISLDFWNICNVLIISVLKGCF